MEFQKQVACPVCEGIGYFTYEDLEETDCDKTED